MQKLEKVIKGFEQCLICGIAEDKCAPCTYLTEPNCITKLKRDALELLKEQQPKKGHWETKIIRGDKAMCCSVCGEDSGTIYDYPFCPNCGAYMGEDGEQE